MWVFEILGVGLVLLAVGGETLLRGGIGLSKVVGLSPVLIGLIVVSISVVAPELSIALQAVGNALPDLAVGSIVGACLFNLLLVLGAAALIRPAPCPPKIVFRDGGSLLVSSLVLVLMARTGRITTTFALVLLAGFVFYLVVSFVTNWRRPAPVSLAESRALARRNTPAFESSVILAVFGSVCLYFGAHYTVESAAAIARLYGVSQAVVGLTLITFGTGLPILVTAIGASARGGTEVIAGQMIGMSVLNILLVLALAAIGRPLPVPDIIAHGDVYILAAVSGVVVSLMLPGWRITRAQGTLLLVCYAGYLVFLAWRQGFVRF